MELLLKSTDDKLFQLELAKLEITNVEKVIENNIQPIALKDCFTFLKSLYVVESYYMDFLRFDVIRTFDELNITEPQSIVLLLEYSNLKAKRHDKSCYIIKTALTYHAYMNGANVTYSNKNNTFSIYIQKKQVLSPFMILIILFQNCLMLWV
jgi:hypothetical protein